MSYIVFNYKFKDFLEQVLLVKDVSKSLTQNKKQFETFEEFFDALQIKTFIIETEYVDKDYLEDFASYYVRAFPAYHRFCVRFHFFDSKFTQDELDEYIANGAKSKLSTESLQKSYKGFIVVKPLPITIFGKTCLTTYPETKGKRFPIKRDYSVHIFGTTLKVESIAFMEQDGVVAACASCAVWSTFHATGKLFQHSIPSPAAITKGALLPFPHLSRHFPNEEGLTAEQVCAAIRDRGLQPEFIIAQGKDTQFNDLMLKSYIYAYLNAGIPVILILRCVNRELRDEGSTLHAVTVLGYKEGKNIEVYSEKEPKPKKLFGKRRNKIELHLKASKLVRIYSHDDQAGPFARLVSFGNLQYRYTEKDGTVSGPEEYTAENIIIPLYEKIRVSFQKIFDTTLNLNKFLVRSFSLLIPEILEDRDHIVWDIKLANNGDFKEQIHNNPNIYPDEKLRILKKSLPRFLWIVSMWLPPDSDDKEDLDGKELAELIFDATDISQGGCLTDIVSIDYKFGYILKDLILKMKNPETQKVLFEAFKDEKNPNEARALFWSLTEIFWGYKKERDE